MKCNKNGHSLMLFAFFFIGGLQLSLAKFSRLYRVKCKCLVCRSCDDHLADRVRQVELGKSLTVVLIAYGLLRVKHISVLTLFHGAVNVEKEKKRHRNIKLDKIK